MKTFFVIKVISKEMRYQGDEFAEYLISSKDKGHNIKDAIKFANYEEAENNINLLSDVELSKNNFFEIIKVKGNMYIANKQDKEAK